MSRTVLPLEDTRASTISELKDLKPQNDHVVTLEGESSPADGKSNFFWWDPSGDPQNADGVTRVESNVENSGLWRRIVTPSPENTDDLSEGSNSLYYTTERVRNAFSAGGDLSYNSNTGEFSVTTSNVNVRDEFEAGGDLTYTKNPPTGFEASTFRVSFDITEDIYPKDATFNNDGTKMFVPGSENEEIFEYDLTTGFDISTASYSGTSFSTSSEATQPEGVEFNGDGTKMFIVEDRDDNVYEYNLSTGFDISTASYSGTGFGVTSEDTGMQGIAFGDGGTKMFLSGGTTNTIYQYDLSTGFDISTASYSGTSLDVSSEETTLEAVTFNEDGTEMYIAGDGSSSILKYNLGTAFDVSTATYSGKSFDVSSETSDIGGGLAYHAGGPKMFLAGDESATIYEYGVGSTGKARFSLDFDSLFSQKSTDDLNEGSNNLYFTDTRAQDAAADALAGGSEIGVTYDNAASEILVEYAGTGGGSAEITDFSTGDHIQFNSYSGEIKFDYEYPLDANQSDWQDAEAIAFNNDGTKIFFTGDNESTSDCIVAEYDLGTAYDIRTLNYTGNTFPNTYGNLTGIDFNGDGTKMFVCDGISDQIIEYTLGSGFDLSSNVSENNTYDTSSEKTGPDGLEFNTDGSKIFVINDGDVYEYSLSTNYDLSTISFTTSFGLEDFENRGVTFNDNGNIMYATIGDDESVVKYELSTPFDVSTASFSGTKFKNLRDNFGRGVVLGDSDSKVFAVDDETILQYTLDPKPEFKFNSSYSSDDLEEGDENIFFTRDRVKDVFGPGGGDLQLNEEDDTYYALGSLDVNSSFDTQSSPASIYSPKGIAFNGDGTAMYLTDSDYVYQFELDRAYDTSTASYIGVDFYTQNMGHITFNDSGSKMILSLFGYQTSKIIEVQLGQNFDLRTAKKDGTELDVLSRDDGARGVAFNADGSKLFFAGLENNNVYEYGLSTNYDIASASFTTSFDVSSETTDVSGLHFNSDGSKMWITGQDESTVYEYDLNTGFDVSTASYSGTSYDASPELPYVVRAVRFNPDGSKMILSGNNYSSDPESRIVEYDSVSKGKLSYSANVSSGISTTDDLDEGNNNLYYTSDRVKSEFEATGDLGYNKNPVSGFDLSVASYSNTSFDVSSEDSTPKGLAFNDDGSKMFILGLNNSNVYEYDLSTAFDTTTASYSGTNFGVGSETGNPRGIVFGDSGTKMYITGSSNDNVYEYELTTGFDVSTASHTGTAFDVSSEMGNPIGVDFNNDGTKMFLVGYSNNRIYEYDLSTGFDLSTASFSVSSDISSEDTAPKGIAFNDDGTKMIVLGTSSNSIHQYELSTGFDVSTDSLTTSFDVSSEDTGWDGLAFNSSGTKMFALGGNNTSVFEYETGSSSDTAQFSVDVPEISAQDDGSGVVSDLASLDFGKALTVTESNEIGKAIIDLDAGFSSATFSGDGTTAQFQIPHGLSSQPSSWIVQSATGDGSDISHVTADGTNLTVNYNSAPPSGTDNVELNWIAIQ